MSKKQNRRPTARAEPRKASSVWLCSPDAFETLCCSGYSSLSQNPEICAGVDTISSLVGSMTIHLMENTPDGDVRIRNNLSRKIDIEPNPYMGRANFIQWIVKTMYLGGDGNAIVMPITSDGYLESLIPIPPSLVSLIPDGWGYKVSIGGKSCDPGSVLHFALNPDEREPWRGAGYRVVLRDVAHNLKQAMETRKGFMESKWKPSIIVKVDAMTEEFSSPSGRRKLLSEYIDTDRAGQPWIIPAEQFDIEQVRPLSLSDLAIADSVKMDKQTVASVLGVPPFVLGEGSFNREHWNKFIDSKIMFIGQIIQQELTRKILYKPEWYFRLNPRSLYSYNLNDLVQLGLDMYACGTMDGDEVRDWAGLSPRGLKELVLLENYIPRAKVGDQKKLKGDDNDGNSDT